MQQRVKLVAVCVSQFFVAVHVFRARIAHYCNDLALRNTVTPAHEVSPVMREDRYPSVVVPDEDAQPIRPEPCGISHNTVSRRTNLKVSGGAIAVPLIDATVRKPAPDVLPEMRSDAPARGENNLNHVQRTRNET